MKQAARDATWDRTDASSLPIGDPPGPMRGLGSRVAAQPPFPEARVGDRPASTQATIRICRLQRWREPGWPWRNGHRTGQAAPLEGEAPCPVPCGDLRACWRGNAGSPHSWGKPRPAAVLGIDHLPAAAGWPGDRTSPPTEGRVYSFFALAALLPRAEAANEKGGEPGSVSPPCKPLSRRGSSQERSGNSMVAGEGFEPPTKGL